MKRFWTDVTFEHAGGGWQVTLDGRGIKTVGGAPQIVPTRALAALLATEWAAQGDTVDTGAFFHRDLADFAIDRVASGRPAAIAGLMRFSHTDTLCYRAEPGDRLAARQDARWDPLLTAVEAEYGVRFHRIAGVIHQPQPAATLVRLRDALAALNDFELAALNTIASLAASLAIALSARCPGADPDALFALANLEQDWQAELWGSDYLAEQDRALRLTAFRAAHRFLRALGEV